MACKLAISSMSLGRCTAGHTLDNKLRTAACHGIQGIELYHQDLVYHATTKFSDASDPELAAAAHIATLCDSLNLVIVCLQPFMHYEGLLDQHAHTVRFQELRRWLLLASTLHTDLIQIPSNFLPAILTSGSTAVIVADLKAAALAGLQQDPPVRFAYESIAWGVHVSTWEQCWEIVQAVDMANFGMCLDTFNIAARVYADPADFPRGVLGGSHEEAMLSLRTSLRKMAQVVEVDKLFYVEVVDGERLAEPLVEGHELWRVGEPARMSWSRNCRLFYGEEERGAYLPVKEICKAIFNGASEGGLGFVGWVSLELWNRRMEEKHVEIPEELAGRARASWERLVLDVGIKNCLPK